MKLGAILQPRKSMKRQGLHNPAVITAVASSPQGQKAIATTLENTSLGVNATVSIVKGVLKMGLFWVWVTLLIRRFLMAFHH